MRSQSYGWMAGYLVLVPLPPRALPSFADEARSGGESEGTASLQ